MTGSLIHLHNVQKKFGHTTVLDGISLDVRAGDVMAVIGPSGSGKSTLLRIVNQLEQHDAGLVAINGEKIDAATPRRQLARIRTQVGMVFQGFHLWPNMSVLDNITLAPRTIRGLSREQADAQAEQLLARVGLSAQRDRRPENLSGGQKQRVAIARALAMEPLAILFDEPTSALDPHLSNEVLEVMADLATTAGVTMMVVTHEIGFARRIANRTVYMQGGRIVQDAPTDTFFEHQQDPDILKFLSHT
ncbi:amino acid ABC transporter ATP-binding protein [Komagataeibacter sp. AV436]|uniref:Amino acid ABC transporter ATP-binding protein n=1 Tax=Komagataeibacter melomenusus TaxID=2766578 RepID=A0ABX2AB59_9PROT|nr:amino acid ABC transporter ATP-binding protein [Komagataeibacter melomenusus]MBV1830131.1 amino acid ABC transporter ATP-binding protein [Komagataeibacter melomenusus]NPC65562.1 amino acid ABC transporter ATP-binding protein [Komagataeibacter melomenusus]